MTHRRWWVPLAAAADLDAAGTSPVAATLFGTPVVLWRDAAGRPAGLVDRCPHRGTRLSIGRVQGGRIECPYHGWQFEIDGRCATIPALPDFTPAASLAASPVALIERHGLVWGCAQPAAGEPAVPFAPDPLDGLPARRVLCGPFDVATSAPRVVENFLDTAHFGFVHEGWLGSRDQTRVPHHDVSHDAHGRPGVPRYLAWQPRHRATAEGGAWIRYRYQLLGPYSALLTKVADAAGTRSVEAAPGAPGTDAATDAAVQEAYVLWIGPTGEDTSRVWFTIATGESAIADADLVAFQQTIFSQDRPLLEAQTPRRLPLGDGAHREVHVAADRLSVAYRRWLLDQGVSFGTC